jgi:hypothetical protein
LNRIMRTTARSRSHLCVGILGTLAAIGSVGVGVWTNAAAPAPGTAPGPVPAERDTVLAIAGRSNATPWIVADGRFVAVAWGATAADGKADVFVAVSRNAGLTFGVPVHVNAQAGEGRLGGELPPRVAITKTASYGGPDVAVLWTARGASTAIRIARSHDGGRTFGEPVTLQSADAAGDRGWPAMTLDDRSVAHAIWLDHRGLVGANTNARAGAGGGAGHGAGGAGHHHAAAASGSAAGVGSASGAGSALAAGSGAAPATATPPRDGVAMAQRSGLYYAALDSTATAMSAPERELTKGVCYCCKTSLIAGRGGALFAAWRQVYPGSFRDIAFSLSRDGGRTFSEPTPISRDGWAIDACPDDGPAMTVDASQTVHVVWPTVIDGTGTDPQGALFYTSTRDGHTFAARTRVPTLGSAKPSHPQIALDGAGRLFIAWDESINGKRIAALREIKPDGTAATDTGAHADAGANGASAASTAQGAASSVTFGPVITLNSGAPGMYPMLASTSDGLIAAWTSPAAGAGAGAAAGATAGAAATTSGAAGSTIKVAKVNLADAAASTAKSGR